MTTAHDRKVRAARAHARAVGDIGAGYAEGVAKGGRSWYASLRRTLGTPGKGRTLLLVGLALIGLAMFVRLVTLEGEEPEATLPASDAPVASIARA